MTSASTYLSFSVIVPHYKVVLKLTFNTLNLKPSFLKFFYQLSSLSPFFSILITQTTEPLYNSFVKKHLLFPIVPYQLLNHIILKGGVGEVWVQLLGGQGACVCVILVLRECIWNTPPVSFVFPAFDDTSFLGSPPRQVVYPSGSILGDCLPFPCEE